VSGIAGRVDHLVLAVHDLAEAAAFCEKLGLQGIDARPVM
jgi:catechol 2,3-dioxygenase-like lactoylglutathione lyase family enzyme